LSDTKENGVVKNSIFIIFNSGEKVKELHLYQKKGTKLFSKEKIEIDSEDLESFSFSHVKDYLEITSKVINGKNILEWFSFKNISYWWFVSPLIHPKYKEGIIFIEKFISIIDKYNPEKIYVKGCFDKLDIIDQICKMKQIKLQIDYSYCTYKIKNKTKNIIQKSRYKKITLDKEKLRCNCYGKNVFEKPSKGYVLITSPGIYRRPALNENGQTRNTEFFIEPFLKIFKEKNIPHLCLDFDYTFRGDIKSLQERLELEETWIPMEIILKSSISKDDQILIKNLEQCIKEFLKYDLSKVFSYKKISLFSYLKPTIESIFLYPHLPYYFYIMKNFRIFLKETKPSKIIQVYEAGPYAKALEIVAKELGIKTVGIQHGLIPSDYPDYMAPEINTKLFPLGNPIPDQTLVYGDFYKTLLTEKGNYPKNKVISIGHPSYYNFSTIKNSLSKNKILQKYKLEKKEIILVPLSFRFFKKSPDNIILNKLYELFKNDSETIVLIRPHPGDKLNQKIISQIYPSNNFICSKHSLFEDMYICKIVISLPASTVSTEAVLFKKPVILVNTFEKIKINEVYEEMIKHDVAILSLIDQLSEKINSIRNNELTIKHDSKLAKDFLISFFNYNQKIDLSDFF
jgi:hypothetical protein